MDVITYVRSVSHSLSVLSFCSKQVYVSREQGNDYNAVVTSQLDVSYTLINIVNYRFL